MHLTRRLFWPAALALGFLVFLAAAGAGNVVKPVSADEGDLCKIAGPEVITEGKTYLYIAYLDADTRHEFSVSIDNVSGDSKITSVVDQDEGDVFYDKISPTNNIHNVEPVDIFDLARDTHGHDKDNDKVSDVVEDLLAVDKNFKLAFNQCGSDTKSAILRILADAKLENLICSPPGTTCDIDGDELLAAANSIVADLEAGETDCADIALNAAKAAIGAGATSIEAKGLQEFVEDVCLAGWDFDVFCPV